MQFRQTIMEISYSILVGEAAVPAQPESVQSIIDHTFAEIDRIYNKWNPASEISQLNRLAAFEQKSLSPELFAFFQKIDPLIRLSQGRFDPTIEPIQELWKSYLKQGRVPSAEEIRQLQPCIGWDKIHFQNGIFYKEDNRSQIDLGGTVKGWCVDLLVERLRQAGYPNVFVEWGGEIRTAGRHPSGRPWNLYISRPADSNPEHALAYLSLNEGALATSGDYFQYWTVKDSHGEEVVYCHVFDPRSCAPLIVKAGGVASASLLADDCLTADSLAKVLMLFDSVAEAEAWVEGLRQTYPRLNYWIAIRA